MTSNKNNYNLFLTKHNLHVSYAIKNINFIASS